jgi:hypothetical protein
MNFLRKSTLGLAGALALHAAARAQDVAMSGNPYTPAVSRNIFGLLPPVVADTAPPPAAEPPVKITPNGITDILGQLEVLFKVAGKTPGKENSYMLTEGQGQDDIEVLKINEKNGIVTFNNHGLVQEIPLVSAPAGAAPAAGNSAIPTPTSVPGANPGGMGFDRTFRSRVGNFGGNIPGGADNGSSPPPMPIPATPASQQPAMSPEEQTVTIEVNRELTKQQVINGEMPPLPPTEMTPPDATTVGGAPLGGVEPQTSDPQTP